MEWYRTFALKFTSVSLKTALTFFGKQPLLNNRKVYLIPFEGNHQSSQTHNCKKQQLR